MRDLRNLAMNARAARSALRQAIQGGRGDEPELDRALAMVEEANELLGRVSTCKAIFRQDMRRSAVALQH